MVESTLRQVWRDCPITEVVATRGKDVRAEPVVALYEQKRIAHCMMFPDGEAQACAFKNTDENEGADYVDSLVWAVWELMGWNSADAGQKTVVIPDEQQAFQSFVVMALTTFVHRVLARRAKQGRIWRQ